MIPELPEVRRARLAAEAKQVSNSTPEVIKTVTKPVTKRKVKVKAPPETKQEKTPVVSPCTQKGMKVVNGTTIYGPTTTTTDAWLEKFIQTVERMFTRMGYQSRPVCVKYIVPEVVGVYETEVDLAQVKFVTLTSDDHGPQQEGL